MTDRNDTRSDSAPQASKRYRLLPDQVPPVPTDMTWVEQLRWAVAVMNPSDPDLRMAASLLSHAIRPGMSPKQIAIANNITDRVWALHAAGRLHFQDPE